MGKVCLCLLTCLLWGCALTRPDSPLPPPDSAALARALSGEPVLGRAFTLDELPEEHLFTLTPAMRLFAEEHTRNLRDPFQRAQALHSALLMGHHHGIRYIPYVTLPPDEAFRDRAANCVSFTLLYVAMARHIGLNAQFNEVDIPDTWDMVGENGFMLLRHVNTRISLPDRSKVVVDLEIGRYSPSYPQRDISPDVMAALYYNNRAMEWLALGDRHRAFLYLRKALSLPETRAYIWSNLGVIYRHAGFYDEAEALYLQALRQSPDDLSTLNNLSELYHATGREQLSGYWLARAERHRNRNPYYLYTKAQRYFSEGETGEAQTLLNQAMRIEPKEPRFYLLAAGIAEQSGDDGRAHRLRQQAEKLQPEAIN